MYQGPLRRVSSLGACLLGIRGNQNRTNCHHSTCLFQVVVITDWYEWPIDWSPKVRCPLQVTRDTPCSYTDGTMILDDGGRGRRRVRSRTSLSPTLGPSSFPSPQSRASSWDTRILAASRHWWQVGPLNCVRWRSLEGVTVTLVTALSLTLALTSRYVYSCTDRRLSSAVHGLK